MAIDSTTLSAANAYRNQLKMMEGINDAPQQEEAGRSTFMQTLEDIASNAIDTQHQTDDIKMQALTGNKVDLADLVTAVSNAEITLSTVVAVRDKVINAYQEILRMPI